MPVPPNTVGLGVIITDYTLDKQRACALYSVQTLVCAEAYYVDVVARHVYVNVARALRAVHNKQNVAFAAKFSKFRKAVQLSVYVAHVPYAQHVGVGFYQSFDLTYGNLPVLFGIHEIKIYAVSAQCGQRSQHAVVFRHGNNRPSSPCRTDDCGIKRGGAPWRKHNPSRVAVYKSGNLAADVQQPLLQLYALFVAASVWVKGQFCHGFHGGVYYRLRFVICGCGIVKVNHVFLVTIGGYFA